MTGRATAAVGLAGLLIGGFVTVKPAAQAADMAAGLLADYHLRPIGPASAGGRVTDVEALDDDFRVVFAAAASGGVWKSVNAGTTWTPIFDHYGTSSIGDIAVYQKDPNIVWVGTGEANNRNSVAWGDGLYKSTDGGTSFTNVGLRDTFQIARVVTHPADPDVVYVAAVGNLWGFTGDRGVFKTTDGGATWQKLTNGLPNDGKTGATDLVIDPANPNTLYVAMYERLRRPWRFDSGGPNGGVFKTTDGGATWRKLTNGLPPGETGRIGLDVYRGNSRVLIALVEAAGDASGVYRSEDAGDSWTQVNRYNNRPFYYSQIRINPSDDQLVYVLTTSFRWSTDGGRTISQAGAPFGSNYDHHAMWIDPHNKDRFYLGKDKGLTLTHDHGATFIFYDNLPIAQFYHVTTDYRDPYAIYGGLQDNGSFGTMSFARDVLGIRNDAAWKMHWDDGMYAAVDPRDWRTVYSEGTAGSFRVIDPLTRTDSSRRATPQNITNFKDATGIDPGAPEARDALRLNWTTPFIISPHDPDVVYYGTNYLLKTSDQGRSWEIVSRDLSKNDPAKNQIGTGGLTPDDTGAESFGTIFSISESPVAKGTIWAGTDDGNVWLTRDGGGAWTQVDATIPITPKDLWVTRIVASVTDANTAYVAFDGHRSDNRTPWLFRTTDGGRTWTSLSAGLPADKPIYVVAEDDKNPDLLFVGTEVGLFASLDRGRTWQPMTNGMPTVAVYDLAIQPRDRDLVVGTHGRGIYILDDLTALEQWRPAMASQPVHVFTQRTATIWEDQSRSGQMGENVYAGENPPWIAPVNFAQRDRARLQNTPVITLGFGAGASGTATLEITNSDGQARSIDIPARPGIVRYVWDGRMQGAGGGRGGGRGAGGGARGVGAGGRGGGGRGGGASLEPGTYALKLTLGDASASGALVVRADPILN